MNVERTRALAVIGLLTGMSLLACQANDGAADGHTTPGGGEADKSPTDGPGESHTGPEDQQSNGGDAGGNGSGGGGRTVTVSVEARQTFPTGLAVASPADLSRGVQFTMRAPTPAPSMGRYLRDTGRALWHATTRLEGGKLLDVADSMLGLHSHARAATGDELELKALALSVEEVLAGAEGAELDKVIDFERLFVSEGGNARCYGPMMSYAMHQDATGGEPNSGQLPTGDLGMWLESEQGSEQPCVAAQLSRRIGGVKGKTQQALLLTAAMRRVVEMDEALAMPAAGETVDLTEAFAAKLTSFEKFGQAVVHAATVGLDGAGEVYRYRLAIDRGQQGSQAGFGEVVLAHRPGADASQFSGLLRVAMFSLTSDQAFGCEEDRDPATNAFQAANVATINYARTGPRVQFGSRSGAYCGHPKDLSAADYASEVAALDDDGQLDLGAMRGGPGAPPPDGPPPPPPMDGGMMLPPPDDSGMLLPPPDGGMVMDPPPMVEAHPEGWVGNSTRFAGDFDLETVEGDFLFAWQAGTGDSHARSLALDSRYNTMTEERTLQGFFGFADRIDETDGTLLGLICNWAGPGHDHKPQAYFQSQLATLAAGEEQFKVPDDGSKLLYAPTNSCSSTTTEFDLNADNMLDEGEGVGVTSSLDMPADGRSVHEEIENRGFVVPLLF